jgi:hypothetical protein
MQGYLWIIWVKLAGALWIIWVKIRQLINILFCGYRRLENHAETYTRRGAQVPQRVIRYGRRATYESMPLSRRPESAILGVYGLPS